MFDIRNNSCIHKGPVIRVASSLELDEYEKELLAKLDTIEHNAQENKLEDIKLVINNQEIPVETIGKTAEIDLVLGELAFKDQITNDDISNQDTFQINCSLD
jgi:hypothetical protein